MVVGTRASNLTARLPGEAASVPRARHLVRDFLVRKHHDPANHPGVLLSVSEAFTNAIVHAYRDGPGNVDIEAWIDGSRLHVVVRDTGVGPDAPTQRPGKGYGMLLIKAHAVDLKVRDRHPGTEVAMTFELSPSPSDQ
jgi:anti-sigma regulatory factor (Ser/Thr protein kinase)